MGKTYELPHGIIIAVDPRRFLVPQTLVPTELHRSVRLQSILMSEILWHLLGFFFTVVDASISSGIQGQQ